MALTHRLSDAATMRLDTDQQGKPVLEIEFKFVRYRLTIDDGEKLALMQELLRQATPKTKNIKGDVEMPRFYSQGKQ